MAITTLSAAQIEAFRRDGAILIEGAVGDEWVSRIRAAIDRDIARPGPFCNDYVLPNGKRFHGNLRLWEHDPDFRDYCLHSPLPGLAARLMGADQVCLFYDQLFVKEPGADHPTRWHNDQPYWPVRGRQVMSFWLALDAVTAESGRMEFVAGSHDWDRWFQPEPFAPGNTAYGQRDEYEPMPDIDAERESHRIIGWDMQPGDLIAFHAMTVHGAGGNRSSHLRRRGYTVRYTGDDATYFPGEGLSAPLYNEALAHGAPMQSERFPLVWAR